MRRRLTLALALLLTATAALAQTPGPPPGTIEYYHVDALGSVRAVTDASGAVVRTHHYHPFGEGVGVEAGTDPMRFTGKPRDGETGLDYFGARYYASRTGRFTTVDPVLDLEQALVDPQQWNRYAYVRNNPLRYTDPDGRAIETLWDVASLGMSIRAVRENPRSAWNWLSLGADIASTALPGLPAIGMGIRAGDKLDDAVDAARTLRAGSGPAAGVLEISAAFKSAKAVQNYAGTGAEFVFDAASGRFAMGSMKHSELVKKAGIDAGATTVSGIIRRVGNKLVTDEQSGTFWRNWTPEMREKFRQFMAEKGISIEHVK